MKNLATENESSYDSLIAIAMTGELKEWSTSVPTGETHYFDFDLFRNCADTNLQLPVKLIEEVDKVYPTIKSLNTIEMEEGK
ncbi:hypothetical protein EFY79_18455 [Hanamia caeni]|uniref:Uncharacterized protein n=1 Tax=Hanamia caeni TaxID=2294116 RepID=A0A3M9N8Q3_9BACT|nr:hypothetical protein [Hanamia caeni]RNI33603.1 hypothetical protein EFY79_18455 [Hanamia caeni]